MQGSNNRRLVGVGSPVEITSGPHLDHGGGKIVGKEGRCWLVASASTRHARNKKSRPILVVDPDDVRPAN